MAHPICGIDVGAFSIKFVVFEVGFRQTVFRGAFEEMVNEGPEPLMTRQVHALREGLSRVSSDAMLYMALPGDQLSIRSFDLPFTDARKIEQVIGYELEGQIVHSLDEVVFDHVVVRSSDEGTGVLAVAARNEDVAAWLEALRAGGIDPRALYAAPVAYHALVIEDDPRADVSGGKVPAILDIGHVRSNLFIGRDGFGMSARTITRGGQHLTHVLRDGLSIDADKAEQLKRNEARLLAKDASPASRREAQIDQLLRTALAPLAREVRQTLASFRAAMHVDAGALYLTGGTARLKGIVSFLEDELGLPVIFLAVPNTLQGSAQARGVDAPLPAGGVDEPADGVVRGEISDLKRTTRFMRVASESSPFALATAIGLAAGRGGREIDLRRGPFLYSVSFSLDAQLKTATQELFGQPRSDAKAVTQLLRKGFREELAPVPRATAYDLLDQISKKVPSDDEIALDIAELDIRPKKTFIKGTVDSATAVDEIAEKLKEIDCYEDVTKGAVTEVSGEAKQFTLNVASKCP